MRAASGRAHGVPLAALVAALLFIDLSPADSVGLLNDDRTRNGPAVPAASPLPTDPPLTAQP